MVVEVSALHLDVAGNISSCLYKRLYVCLLFSAKLSHFLLLGFNFSPESTGYQSTAMEESGYQDR